MPHGIEVKDSEGGARIQIRSRNQAGLLYAVRSEASWVATNEDLAAHALAGFLNELTQKNDPGVIGLMRKWGLSFRTLDLEIE